MATTITQKLANKPIEQLRDKAWARWTALALLALAMFCSYIFMDILSPIKNLMQSEAGWDSTAFGTMQGSETFLNVFIFFLIFAGIILDKMGVRFTALLSGAVMVVGGLINWYALTTHSPIPVCKSGSPTISTIYPALTSLAYHPSTRACRHRPNSQP